MRWWCSKAERTRHVESTKGHVEVQPRRGSDTVVVQITTDKNTTLDSRKYYCEGGIETTDGG